MIAKRLQKLLSTDVTSFFGDFRQKEVTSAQYNLGLGEIICQNPLLNALSENPQEIISAITSQLPHYPGCQGYMPLNEKIAELFETETGIETDAADIILTNGGYDGLSHALFAVTDPADVVHVPVPSFPYWCNTARVGAKLQPMFCATPTEFSNHLSELFEKSLTARSSALILNVPHNPFGVNLSEKQAVNIDELAQKNGVAVILDDVYRAFSQKQWIGKHFEPENMIVVDSFSKRFALPGLRLGFLRVSKNNRRAVRAAVANHSVGVSGTTASLADAVLSYALKQNLLSVIPSLIRERHAQLIPYLEKMERYGLYSPPPEDGMFRLLYCRNASLFSQLLFERGVVVKTSAASYPYTIAHPEFIRLSVSGESRINEAARIILSVAKEFHDMLSLDEKPDTLAENHGAI